MTGLADKLLALIDQWEPQLREITERDAAFPHSEAAWSRKELIGHLIDSASNNHQRFVRMQLHNHLELPSYDQEHWVSSQRYEAEPWSALLDLWSSYNRHLTHVIRYIPEHAAQHVAKIGGGEPVTLRFVIEDYLVHLEHHLHQTR
jgi:hypothetical protein